MEHWHGLESPFACSGRTASSRSLSELRREGASTAPNASRARAVDRARKAVSERTGHPQRCAEAVRSFLGFLGCVLRSHRSRGAQSPGVDDGDPYFSAVADASLGIRQGVVRHAGVGGVRRWPRRTSGSPGWGRAARGPGSRNKRQGGRTGLPACSPELLVRTASALCLPVRGNKSVVKPATDGSRFESLCFRGPRVSPREDAVFAPRGTGDPGDAARLLRPRRRPDDDGQAQAASRVSPAPLVGTGSSECLPGGREASAARPRPPQDGCRLPRFPGATVVPGRSVRGRLTTRVGPPFWPHSPGAETAEWCGQLARTEDKDPCQNLRRVAAELIGPSDFIDAAVRAAPRSGEPVES